MTLADLNEHVGEEKRGWKCTNKWGQEEINENKWLQNDQWKKIEGKDVETVEQEVGEISKDEVRNVLKGEEGKDSWSW